MGTDIYGWVEVYDEEDDMWDGIIRASSLMERDYEVFAALFGVRNHFGFQPVAEHRGLPENLSPQTETELEDWERIVKPSWITWQQIKQVEWQNPLWRSWTLLFEMMALLGSRYEVKNVRLVIWFDQ